MSQNGAMLRIADVADTCSTLGPGIRAIVWVQGCTLACPGCIAPEKQSMVGGRSVPIDSLAHHICSLGTIEGITLSGGEPFLQAGALVKLVAAIQKHRDLSVMAYTGYTLPYLRDHGHDDQHALLALVDILVDGPFIAERATAKLWRGSDNQCVHFLTPRYACLSRHVDEEGVHLDIQVGADGTVMWMGIPPPGFRERFEQGLRARHIKLTCLS